MFGQVEERCELTENLGWVQAAKRTVYLLFLVIHGMLQHVVLVLPYVLLFAPFANFEFLSKMMME
jgi:hypothetical protein